MNHAVHWQKVSFSIDCVVGNFLTNFRSNIINFVIVFILAIYQLSTWHPGSETSFMHKLALDIFGPLQLITMGVKTSIKEKFDQYLFLVDVKKENETLRQNILSLEDKLLRFSEIELENTRLKDQLSYVEPKKLKKIFARVVSWDAYKDFRVIRINQGASVGIKVQDPVVTPEGFVGSIYSVSENFSEILLLNDVNSRVDIINARTRARGIVEGFSESKLVLKYSELREQYSEGDMVLTAGLSFLPKGIVVGRVVSIEQGIWGLKQKILLEPVVDLVTLEDLMVLVSVDPEIKPEEKVVSP